MAQQSDLRRRRLGRLATDTGQFAILAIDHVRSFTTTARPDDPDSLMAGDINAIKARVIDGLAEHATGVLIDPGFGTSPGHAGAASGFGGVIFGIEDGDYENVRASPRLLPGWSVERAADLGADAVKISVYFDPDDDTSVAEHFVEDVIAQCRVTEMPLFCEPLAVLRDSEDRRRLVLEGVKRFGALGPDILKIQFPEDNRPHEPREIWTEACNEVEAASPVPWTLLSEGDDYTLFRDRLAIACRAGASGFLGGRAVWRDAAMGSGDVAGAAARLDELRSIVVADGAAWTNREPRLEAPAAEGPS